jgi:hypothetical protein
MLVPTETGFIEIVKEPQFDDIYTVQATDSKSIRAFHRNTLARVIRSDYSRTYRFQTHAHLYEISTALDMVVNSKDIEVLTRNISPEPVGYRVHGFWHDKEEDVQADVLAGEVEKFKQENYYHFDEFMTWPLFEMTAELIEQMNKAA